MSNLFSMRRWSVVALIAITAAGIPASAEVVQNYSESFSGLSTDYNLFAPRGWKHSVSSEWYANTYVSHEDGGHTAGWIEAKKPSSTYYYDGFISPKITGTATVWVKLTAADGKVDFFVSSDGTSIGYSYSAVRYTGTINGNDQLAVGEWKQITLPDVAANTHLVIVPINCGICDFTAASADVQYVNKLKLDLIKNVTTPLEANSENQVTMDVKLKFTNIGDYDVAENTPGFTVNVVNNHTDTEFASVPVTVAIPRNKVVEVPCLITGPATLAPNTTSNNFVFTESLTQATASSYFSIVPFAPVYNFVLAENGTHPIESRLSYGMTTAPAERTFYIYNSGTDVLTVNSINLTGDYELVTPATGEIAAKANFPVTVRFKATSAGLAEGSLQIETAQLGSYAYSLEGLRREETKFFESFEGETRPAGFVYDSNWLLKSDVEDLKTEGNSQWIAQNQNSAQGMITPLLTFAEGDLFSLYANKSDNMSGNLTIQTSTDRQTWTDVYQIGATSTTANCDAFFGNEPPTETGTGYGKYAFQLFNVPMAAGNLYVRLNGGGVRVQDLYGGNIVPVAHDVMYVKQAPSASGMVNNPYAATVTFRNVATSDEEGFTVALMVGDEIMATADATEFAGGSDVTFPITWYPRQAGEMNAYFRFLNADYVVDTPEFPVKIAAETATKIVQVGEKLISQSGIINPYYKNSATQIILTPERLGLTPGSIITGLHNCGYLRGDIAGNLRIWMTTSTQLNFEKESSAWSAPVANAFDPDDMDLVFDGPISQQAVGTASQVSAMENLLFIAFDDPYTYTGDNLVMMVEFNRTSPTDYQYYSTFDNSTNPDAKFITFSTDRDMDDLDLEWKWSINTYGIPVNFFNVEKESAVAEGIVKDAETQEPIAGAVVTFSDGPVAYSAVTAEDGTYSTPIFQAERTYNATVESEGYLPHQSEGHSFVAGTEPNIKNFELVYDPQSGISDRFLDEETLITVYTLSGTVVLENTTKGALRDLEPGLYLMRTPRGTIKLRR